jgi:F0F1-type ATP synthase membrane subunit b/b'
MKRFAFGLWFALPLYAAGQPGGEKDMTGYLWANFFILALALGWLINKHGGPFLAARSEAIRQGITEGERSKAEAARRISEVDAKLATLGSEIDRLKNEMRREQMSEVERVRARNVTEIAHIEQQARLEVESAYKGARLQLEEHAGKLALELAESKIRSRMNPDAERKLTREFVGSLS